MSAKTRIIIGEYFIFGEANWNFEAQTVAFRFSVEVFSISQRRHFVQHFLLPAPLQFSALPTAPVDLWEL